MAPRAPILRIPTGIANLDSLLHGGLPKGSMTLICGSPGSGKTTLAQQFCFHNAAPGRTALYFQTLSQPTAKALLYMSGFAYFDAEKLETCMWFVDLGIMARGEGLRDASEELMAQVREVQPAIVVIDTFKAFDDLAGSREELRKFGYDVAVSLMAWECTSLLLGEYAAVESETNPLLSIVDGIIMLGQRHSGGEAQRVLQVVKMRGTEHEREECPFAINSRGVEVFAPRLTIRRAPLADIPKDAPRRRSTGIAELDTLLGDGIPRGSTVLVAGVSGTGKTVLGLEFLYRGAAERNERGILFSFEETEERLRATARGLGWDLESEIARGRIAIVFVPQPDIHVEENLQMMRERIEAMGVDRVVIDSVSVFLNKLSDPEAVHEKTFQLATIIQNVQAVGFLTTDIPYGSSRISRFGVEETVVDGVILLTSTEEGLERQRYIEIYKLRNSAHLTGRHSMMIKEGGIRVFPRYVADEPSLLDPPTVRIERRLESGLPGLDPLLGGGLLERSVTLVSGSAGIGKSTLGMQFLVAGAALGERGLYVSLEEGPEQIRNSAHALGIDLRGAVDRGMLELVYLSGNEVRAVQFLALLTARIEAQGTRRVVLDSASHLEQRVPVELAQLLSHLVVRFKALGVTSMLTLESKSLHAFDDVSDHGMSPLADNLIVLRYVGTDNDTVRALCIVKTRGSSHATGRHEFRIQQGGLAMGPRLDKSRWSS